MDYFSKFCEISLLADTSSPTIITHMKSMFARHGTPKVGVSDNQLDTKEFKNFQKEWDFKLTTSSPQYPKFNGMAERTVQTVKKLLKKALANGEDPYLALPLPLLQSWKLSGFWLEQQLEPVLNLDGFWLPAQKQLNR